VYRASPLRGAVNVYLEDGGRPDAPELDAEPLADTEAERNGTASARRRSLTSFSGRLPGVAPVAANRWGPTR
jgi:hypothetical protein